MTGKISNGFEFTVDESMLDNMELIEAIAAVDDGEVLKLPKLVELLLGKDNKARLYDSVRESDGRVPTTAVAAAIKEIFDSIRDGKKS